MINPVNTSLQVDSDTRYLHEIDWQTIELMDQLYLPITYPHRFLIKDRE